MTRTANLNWKTPTTDSWPRFIAEATYEFIHIRILPIQDTFSVSFSIQGKAFFLCLFPNLKKAKESAATIADKCNLVATDIEMLQQWVEDLGGTT